MLVATIKKDGSLLLKGSFFDTIPGLDIDNRINIDRQLNIDHNINIDEDFTVFMLYLFGLATIETPPNMVLLDRKGNLFANGFTTGSPQIKTTHIVQFTNIEEGEL